MSNCTGTFILEGMEVLWEPDLVATVTASLWALLEEAATEVAGDPVEWTKSGATVLGMAKGGVWATAPILSLSLSTGGAAR